MAIETLLFAARSSRFAGRDAEGTTHLGLLTRILSPACEYFTESGSEKTYTKAALNTRQMDMKLAVIIRRFGMVSPFKESN